MKLLLNIQAGFLIFAVVSGSSSVGCPEGWLNIGCETCIKLQPPVKNMSWSEAQRQCDELDGYLPELHTSTLVSMFYDLMITYDGLFGTTGIYLGASDQGHEGDWTWVFNGGVVDDNHWGEGSPSTEPHNQIDCLITTTTGDSFTWKDVDCIDQTENIQIAQLCMRSIETATTTQTTTMKTTTHQTITQLTTSYPDSTIASTIIPTPSPSSCPPDHQYFKGHCYIYYMYRFYPDDAESFCQEQGGHLPSIHSEEENEFVASLVSHKAWIGLHKVDETWVFTDGTAVDYLNWHNGRPDVFGPAVFMDKPDYEWHDTEDYSSCPFVCKMPVLI